MRRRSKAILLGALVVVVGLFAGGLATTANAQGAPFPNPHSAPVQYMAKYVCGYLDAQQEEVLKPGNYATAINLGNPGIQRTDGKARIHLHYPNLTPPGSLPPPQPVVNVFVWPYRTAEIDCPFIWSAVGVPPGTFLKGFVHLGFPVPLPVTAVYTAQTDINPVVNGPDAGAGMSIDVEVVQPWLVGALD